MGHSQCVTNLPPVPITEDKLDRICGGMMNQYFYDPVGGGFCGVGVHDYTLQMSYTAGIVKCP
jgi:hypothetical protein